MSNLDKIDAELRELGITDSEISEKTEAKKVVSKKSDIKVKTSKEHLPIGDSDPTYELPDSDNCLSDGLEFGDGAIKDTYVEIEEMVRKTNEMNAISSEKTKEIEQQFKDIQKRLDKNVEILNTIKEEMKSFSFDDEKARLRELHDFNPGDCLENSITREDLEAEMEEVKMKLASLSEGTNKLSTISKETLEFSKKIETAIEKFDELPEHE